jgi:hypothetical protein
MLAICVLASAEPMGWANVDLSRGTAHGRSEVRSGPMDSSPACLTGRPEWQSQASDSSRHFLGFSGRLSGRPMLARPHSCFYGLWTWLSALSHSLQVDHVRLQI